MVRTKAQGMGTLDLLRRRHGNEAVRDAFYDLCVQDSDRAAELLNADNVKFSTLFVLHPEIDKFDLHGKLNARNNGALSLGGCLCSRETALEHVFGPEDILTLRWMLTSGYDEDDLGETYDEVMDAAAILLTREYRDATVLPHLCDMVFLKNRRGLYIYDAVWALFESQEPQVLQMVSDRLLSAERHDVELARSLLHFLPGFDNGLASPAEQHRNAAKWLKTNRPWLRYTGESNQKGSNPFRFEVSLEAKYLQNAEVARNGPEILSADDYDRGCRFHALDDDTKALLAEHSAHLHRRSIEKWRRWMRAGLDEQVRTARRHAGLEVGS